MKKIVYIGNDLKLENLIFQFFTDHNIVTQVVNEEEAFELIKTNQPDIFLIELHISRPMDGYELGKKIRLQSEVPIMFTSSKRQNLQIGKALYLPHADHVCKPINIEEMVTRMNLLITRTIRPSELYRYQIGKAIFKVCDQMLVFNELNISLSRLETVVLLELYHYRNRHIDRPQVICHTWNTDNWKSYESSFQNILWKLRKCLALIEDVTIDTHIKQKIKLCVPE
ncbi:MAG: response regulator [Paludibacter sp.]|nr:response regulator [Paludibacter sp.]